VCYPEWIAWENVTRVRHRNIRPQLGLADTWMDNTSRPLYTNYTRGVVLVT